MHLVLIIGADPNQKHLIFFFLLQDFLKINFNFLLKNNVKIKFIGEKIKLSKNIINLIKKVEKLTEKKNDLTLIVAFNYSSKQEIINTFLKIAKNKKQKKLTEEIFKNNLYTRNIPDPDILIRTGNHTRVSNFLLWQLSYTEIFFIKKLWPDFNTSDLKKIVLQFKKIKRNFGGI